jgi:hypothetical protein
LLCRSGYAKAQQAGIIPLKSKLYYDENVKAGKIAGFPFDI